MLPHSSSARRRLPAFLLARSRRRLIIIGYLLFAFFALASVAVPGMVYGAHARSVQAQAMFPPASPAYTYRSSIAKVPSCFISRNLTVTSKFPPYLTCMTKLRVRGLMWTERSLSPSQSWKAAPDKWKTTPSEAVSRSDTPSLLRHSSNGRRLTSGCRASDISITQGMDNSHGIPQYSVEIVNSCLDASCAPSNVHLSCGWFASALLVNPTVFKRIAYNDCLVNNGKPLRYGDIVSFQYANSFMYPLTLKSVKLC